MGILESLKGTITAIVTPFSADGQSLDLVSLQNLIDFQVGAGVDGIVVCGSTGEGVNLSDAEYRNVIQSAVGFVKHRVPCIVGVGSSSTNRAREMAAFVDDTGADAILLVAPAYNKPPQAGILAHFHAVRSSTRLPIIAYNVPGRTSVNILPETIGSLAKDGIIVGLKEACGSIAQVLDTVALTGRSISILSGEDGLIHATMASGGRGVISVLSNAFPSETLAITSAALDQRWEDSLQAQIRALPLVRAMFCETNPIPVKAALALKGIIKFPSLRLPLVQAQPATIERLQSLIGR